MQAHTYVFTNEMAPADVIVALPRAYSYIRFSTKRQGRGDSLRRQLERSRLYAAENNLDFQEATYEDLGISAFDRSNLEKGALKAFITAAETGNIPRGSYLIVENLDRISRADVMDAMELVTRIVKLGVKVVSLDLRQVLDEETIKDPMVVIMVMLNFVRANEESATKADRVSKSHARKRKCQDPFSFGQGPGWLRPNADKSGWEKIPEKVESVQKVFAYTANGFGATAIARIANNEGWPVPGTATDWHKTLPNKLVHNRRVLGEFEPHVKIEGKRVPTGELWANYYPRIIDETLFNEASAAANRRRHLPKRRDAGYHNIFQGMLQCGLCGATLARKAKSSSRNSVGYALYTCSNRDRGVTKCKNWNARELEDSLIVPLMETVARNILKGTAQRQAKDALDAERAGLAHDRKAIANLLTTVEHIGATDYVSDRIRNIEKRIKERAERIVDLNARANDPASSVWQEDIEEAQASALIAVRDVTDKLTAEREAIHQSLLKVVRVIRVRPDSLAAVELYGQEQTIALPLYYDSVRGGNVLEFLQQSGGHITFLATRSSVV
jgi:DNA invertase Pin-like site-specific DNA recombinase